ncbi:SusC/RagA family TonB-linked outer membrane protein [Pedobacter sp. MW01-1-1]|uniref:SusC/RagA family TonB-linked outer membrane protein n=1 Tax=Pedobacter sp. MW01-1-1 TaxID=3383027 RepID=UPI003FF02085
MMYLRTKRIWNNPLTYIIPPKAKLIFLLVLISILKVSAATMKEKITVTAKNIPLVNMLSNIKNQTNYDFVFNNGVDLTHAKPVSLQVSDEDLNLVLKKIFINQPLLYSIEGNTIIIKQKETASSFYLGIDAKGRVLDENGKPLAGATVKAKKSGQTTQTDAKGNFVLTNVEENETIQISFVGHEILEIKASKNIGDVKLMFSSSNLQEVNITFNTGYQKLTPNETAGSFNFIDKKKIENKLQTNVLERLEGMAPGLMLINGKDGGDDALTIRGVSTLYGTKRPLIVVDNFPIEGDINSINPNDVENITILKDAAAASIWGARAANGVIVITTKSGLKSDIIFQYSNSFQFQPKPDLGYLNRLSSADDINIERELLKNIERSGYSYETLARWYNYAFSAYTQLYMDSAANRISPAEYLAQVNRLKGIDNTQQIKDLLMQAPFTQNHSLSFRGGSEKNNYYGSFNYVNSNGYNLRSSNNNYVVFLKSNHRISNKLSFGVNANINFSNGTRAPLSAASIYNLKPYSLLQDEAGNPLSVNRLTSSENSSNPYSIAQRVKWGLQDESYIPLNEVYNKDLSDRANAQRLQAELQYKITDGIKFNLSYQVERGSSVSRDYTRSNQADLVKQINDFITPSYTNTGGIATNPDGTLLNPYYNLPLGGKLNEQTSDYAGQVIRGVLSIDKKIKKDHHFLGMFGLENKESTIQGNGVTKYGYDDVTLNFIQVDWQYLQSLPSSLRQVNSPFTGIQDYFDYVKNRFVSLFGNGAYTYKDKYIASGSIRIDQTNLFGTDPKYYYKPMWSAGLAWVATNEDFLAHNNVLNNLKVRVTYGINGNIPKNSGPFEIATAGINTLTQLPSNRITTPVNSTLRWEKTATTNIGLDYALLKSRISGTIDYYYRNSSDILGNENINPTYGFSNAVINAASMVNKGIELQLTTRNIVGKNFSWSTILTYANNRNKITKSGLTDYYTTPTRIAANSPYLEGMPYGGLYSLRYGGLTSDYGQLLVKNADGEIEPNSQTTRLDLAYFSGSKRPIHNGALTNQFNYKNLSFSFMFVFYTGHVARQNTPGAGLNNPTSYDARLANAWKMPGDEATTHIPNVITRAESYIARNFYANYLDVNVFRADYAKLREVIFTYNLSPEQLRGIKFIKSLQFNLQGRNLLTITKNKLGIDPEAFANQQRTMPVSPTYAFGINVTF